MGKSRESDPPPNPTSDAELIGPLRVALVDAAEPRRYRLLATLFQELADLSGDGVNGQPGGLIEQLKSASARNHSLQEDLARLRDELAGRNAEYAVCAKRLEAETQEKVELQRRLTRFEPQLAELQREREALQAKLAAVNNELHRAGVEIEQTQLKLQRAEKQLHERARSEASDSRTAEIAARCRQLEDTIEQLRVDRDAEIERLNAELETLRGSATAGAETTLASLWHRLASLRPPLADPGQPNQQAADRLIGALAEFATFADECEKDMRVIVGNGLYTKDGEQLRMLWNDYMERDELRQTVRQTLAARAGRPTAVLRTRLDLPRRWLRSALWANDSALQSLDGELTAYLRDPEVLGGNPKLTVRDFVAQSGPSHFMEHMRRFRNRKLEELLGQ